MIDEALIPVIKDMQQRLSSGQRMVRDQSGKVYAYMKDGSLRRLSPKTSKKARRRAKNGRNTAR